MAYDMRKATQGNKPDADEEWLKRYEADRRSVFVGNLPTHMENLADDIRRVFCEAGDIVQVNVIQREPRAGLWRSLLRACALLTCNFLGGTRVNAFAFVEFTRPDMAEIAIHRMVSVYALSNRYIKLTWQLRRTTPTSVVFISALNASRAVTDRVPASCVLKPLLAALVALVPRMIASPPHLFDRRISMHPFMQVLLPERTTCLVTCRRRMPTFLPRLKALQASWVLIIPATPLRRCITRVAPS